MPLLINIVLIALVTLLAMLSVTLVIFEFYADKIEKLLTQHKKEWEQSHYE